MAGPPLNPLPDLRVKVRYSQPFLFQGRLLKFRLLDQREHQWCRISALARARDALLERFKVEEADRLLSHMLLHDELLEDNDLYLIAAALCLEDGTAAYDGVSPDDACKALADTISPVERTWLAEQYFGFALAITSGLDADAIERLADEVEKDPGPFSQTPYDSSSLRSLVLSLAARLRAARSPSPMTESSDGT